MPAPSQSRFDRAAETWEEVPQRVELGCRTAEAIGGAKGQDSERPDQGGVMRAYPILMTSGRKP